MFTNGSVANIWGDATLSLVFWKDEAIPIFGLLLFLKGFLRNSP